MGKVPHGALRPPYVPEPTRDARGVLHDSRGRRIVMDPARQTPRRGFSGDKLRRKAYERKL